MHAGDMDLDSSCLCALLFASLRPVDILLPKQSPIYLLENKKNEEARTFGLRISEYTEKIDFADGLGGNAKKFERT